MYGLISFTLESIVTWKFFSGFFSLSLILPEYLSYRIKNNNITIIINVINGCKESNLLDVNVVDLKIPTDTRVIRISIKHSDTEILAVYNFGNYDIIMEHPYVNMRILLNEIIYFTDFYSGDDGAFHKGLLYKLF